MTNDDLPGYNVIGHLSSPTGLGNTARLFCDVLRRKGHPVEEVDIEYQAHDSTADTSRKLYPQNMATLRFERSLMIVTLSRLPHLWLKHQRSLLRSDHRSAGVVFWELPVMPKAWLPSLRLFDAIVACSHWVRQIVEAAVSEVPTVFAEHPLAPHIGVDARPATRQRFGLRTGVVTFCTSFDVQSGLVRKNSIATVQAWQRAFPRSREVALVLKVNGRPESSGNTDLRALLAEIAADDRIVMVAEDLPHSDVMKLFDCCDVFLSLHRSEGLGLVPLEAMSLGKLVIATGYSGTVTYMTEHNSMPVPYHLVEPVDRIAYFSRRFAGTNAAWAEPDLVTAIELMRAAAADPALRSRLRQRAAADVALRQASAWSGRWIDELTRVLRDSERVGLRGPLRRQVALQEILDPTIRRMNSPASSALAPKQPVVTGGLWPL